MIQTIAANESPATWPSKVKTLIDYWNGETALSSFAGARAGLNAIASDMGLPTLDDMAPANVQRGKLNALITKANETIPEDASLYLDFLNNRYFGGVPTDTHATDILALGSTGYETFAPNVLPRTDLGLLTTVERTNLVWNSANVYSAWGTAGDTTKEKYPDTVLDIFNDGAIVASAGQSWHRANSTSFTLEQDKSYAVQAWYMPGTSGQIRVVVRSNTESNESGIRGPVGSASPFEQGAGDITNVVNTDLGGGLYRVEFIFTPNAEGSPYTLGIGPNTNTSGNDVVVLFGSIEEGTFATDPIITEGSEVTRPGNRPVVSFQNGELEQGFCGVYQMDWLGVESFKRHLAFRRSGGGPADFVDIQTGSAGGPRWFGQLGGVNQGVGAVSSENFRKTGLITVAFGISNEFRSLRVVGDIQRDDPGKPLPPGLDVLGIGNDVISTGNNTYAQFKRLALKFGPQDQTSFDAMYALAQEWAAE